MQKLLIILDFDGTLVDRSPSGIENKIPFTRLIDLKHYFRNLRIDLSYAIVTSSCCDSIEEILTVKEMKSIDEWFFENGLHVKRYSDHHEALLSNDRVTEFNRHRSEILPFAQGQLGPQNSKIIRSVSQKHSSIAIHVYEKRDRLFQILVDRFSNCADCIKSGLYTIEIFPKDCNKVISLEQIDAIRYEKVIFIGDSIYQNGNDYAIANHPQIDLSIEVSSTLDSATIIDNIISLSLESLFDPKALDHSQARIVRNQSQKNGLSRYAPAKKFLLLDFDGTMTFNQGFIHPDVLRSLHQLRQSFLVWVITGRSKGWADMMINTFPLDGVIAENGAFAFYRGNQQEISYWQSTKIDPEYRKKLVHLSEELKRDLPDVVFASDQFSREFDLAIVSNENGVSLSREQVDHLSALCWQNGAKFKISNIHINAWFGHYNKAQSVVDLFHEIYQIGNYDLCRGSVYIGDSPNDEPMFRLISYTIGVKNIEDYLDKLKYPPSRIVDAYEGEGLQIILNELLANVKVKES